MTYQGYQLYTRGGWPSGRLGGFPVGRSTLKCILGRGAGASPSGRSPTLRPVPVYLGYASGSQGVGLAPLVGNRDVTGGPRQTGEDF